MWINKEFKKKDRIHIKNVHLRLDEETHAILKQSAAETGDPIAIYIRRLCQKDARTKPKYSLVRPKKYNTTQCYINLPEYLSNFLTTLAIEKGEYKSKILADIVREYYRREQDAIKTIPNGRR